MQIHWQESIPGACDDSDGRFGCFHFFASGFFLIGFWIGGQRQSIAHEFNPFLEGRSEGVRSCFFQGVTHAFHARGRMPQTHQEKAVR